MNAVLLHRSEDMHDQLWSWTVSLLLHGLAVGAALILVADLRLAPQPEPFRWVVSQIEPQTQAEAPAPAQAPRLARDQPASAPHPAETLTAARTVAAPSPAQERAARNVPEATPLLQPAPEPVQPKTQPVEPPPAAPPIVQQQNQSQAIRQAEAIPLEPETARLPRPAPVETPGREPVQPGPETARQTAALAHQGIAAAPASSQEAAKSLQTHDRHPVAPAAEDTPAPQESATVASLAPTLQPAPVSPSGQIAQPKADFGWLAGAIRARVEQLKHYPHMARANRWEGRVVLRAVIGENGQLVDLKVSESSGHSVLDEAAVEVLKKAAPLTLPQPLGRPQVVVQVPISYKLR